MSDKGAHFYRCDFQVHTPRDLNWTGSERVTEESRREYSAQLVQACRDRDIKGIAVTDHHDMAFVPYVRRAAAEDRGKIFDTAERAVQSWRDGTVSIREGAAGLRATVESHLAQVTAAPAEPEGGILKAAHDEYQSLLNDAKTALDALVTRSEAISGADVRKERPRRQWSEKRAEFRRAYEAAVQRSSAHSEELKQLQVIEDQLAQHVRETARVREELRSLSTAEGLYSAERQAWEAQLKEHDELLDERCKTLTEASGGAIRARVKRFADSEDFVNSLRQSLTGSRIQGGKIERLGETITGAGDEAGAQWTALLLDLEKLAEIDAEMEGSERRPESKKLLEDAKLLFDCDRYSTALALAVLAQEEFAKGFLLQLVRDAALPWVPEVQPSIARHQCKHLLGIVMEWLPPVDWDKAAERHRRWNEKHERRMAWLHRCLERYQRGIFQSDPEDPEPKELEIDFPVDVADALNILRHEEIERLRLGSATRDKNWAAGKARRIVDGLLDRKKQSASTWIFLNRVKWA